MSEWRTISEGPVAGKGWTAPGKARFEMQVNPKHDTFGDYQVIFYDSAGHKEKAFGFPTEEIADKFFSKKHHYSSQSRAWILGRGAMAMMFHKVRV